MSPNDLTLSTKRKMSQRQRLRRIDQSTQTNSRDFSHDAVSLASHSSGRSSGHFSSCSYNSVSTDSGIGPIPDVEYCEDPTQLHERLLRAEEVSFWSNSIVFFLCLFPVEYLAQYNQLCVMGCVLNADHGHESVFKKLVVFICQSLA